MFYKGKKTKGKLLERGFHGNEETIRLEIENSADPRIQNIIDIGTGSGRTIRILADILENTQIISLDPSSRALETVKSMLTEESIDDRVSLITCVGESLPLKNGFCYAVFSVMSFHHISKIEDVLKEVFRVLSSDGKLVVIDWTPEASSLMNQPPSHFLPLSSLTSLLTKLELYYLVNKYPSWYIANVYTASDSVIEDGTC